MVMPRRLQFMYMQVLNINLVVHKVDSTIHQISLLSKQA